MEEEVEELLRQIALAKHKELRLKAEKSRLRDEIGQLQAGTLWSREEQTQHQLSRVRRAKDQLETRRKTEEEKLMNLNESLKEQELKFRKNTDTSPFQQAATAVVAPAASLTYISEQGEGGMIASRSQNNANNGDIGGRSLPLVITSPPETSTCDGDALLRLVGGIKCEEQQKRIETLQVELQKAHSRRQEAGFDQHTRQIPSSGFTTPVEHLEDDFWSRSCLGSPTAWNRGADNGSPPVHTRRILSNPTKTVSKVRRPNSQASPPCLDSAASLDIAKYVQNRSATIVPDIQPVDIASTSSSVSPPQAIVPGWPPVSISPYSLIPLPLAPPGYGNLYSTAYVSAYLPTFSYPSGLPPWFGHGVSCPNPDSYFSGIAPPEHQHEIENQQIERELQMQRLANELRDEGKDVAELQDRLQLLQVDQAFDTDSRRRSFCTSINNSAPGDVDDAVLKNLKRQHLENLAKVRNERDLLEEQEQLEDLKERIQRRKEEKKRELDHEDWVAKQKRKIISLRLQHALSEDEKSNELPFELQGKPSGSYNSDRGFVILWDYAAGVPTTISDLQITYALFEGKTIRTPFKVVPTKSAKVVDPQHKQCSFDSSRHVRRLVASPGLRVVVEVASIMQNAVDCLQIPTSLGWTAFEVFKTSSKGQLELVCGFFKLPVTASLMPDPSKTLVVPPSTDDCGDIRIHIRLVDGEHAADAPRMLVDPESHAVRYQLPESNKTVSRLQINDITNRPRSSQGQDTPTGTPASFESVGGQKRAPSQGHIDELAELPPSASSPKQDFVDIDRLRLSSSASSRPPTTRPRSNIPISGGDKPRLPPFCEDCDAEKYEPWIFVDKTLERQRSIPSGGLFQPGDGFNVYVDGGRGFPDNVTISKVTVAALNSDRTQVATENGSAFAPTSSIAFDPVFDAYMEYRQSSFNPTLTLVIRVDTIELASRQPVIMGYSVFPVFVDVETQDQPSRPSILQFELNAGGFQLPIHTQLQSADTNQPFSSKSCESFPRIPCATVLLRILRARMSGDGLALLSRKDLSMQEWEAKGLLAPAPHYCDHFYDSLRCIPSGIEEKIYANRHKRRKPKTIDQCLQLISLSETVARDILKGKPLHYLELKSALQYEPAMGFRVAIDALYNVKTKGFPIFKVLFSVYPPGAFYQPTRLTGDVFFTTSMDWTSAQISPEFGDGYTTLWGSPSDRLLAVIFDVQTISRHSKTGAITLQQYGWTFLPVLANSRSVDTCSIQLPLFQGDVNLDVLKTATDGLSALVNNVGNYKVKQLSLVAEDGASLFVRLHDPQIPHLSTQPIVNATLSKMIPSQLSVKYNYDGIRIAALKKKAPLSKLLPTSIPKAQFEKDLNQAFANNMGIRHLLF